MNDGHKPDPVEPVESYDSTDDRQRAGEPPAPLSLEPVDYAALESEEAEYFEESEDSPCQPVKAKDKGADTKPRVPKPRKEITIDQLEKLLLFDKDALRAPRKNPVELVVGTDEVGRGCLAGPVVACAVILPEIDPRSDLGWQLARLNDSKQVHPLVRAELSEVLRGICRFGIGEASVEEIDEINILQASLLAMRRAIRRLNVEAPAVVLVDGNKKIHSRKFEQMTVIDGDTKSASIAAASIIAKVHRDTFMAKLAKKFPHYRWDSNKGYRSRDHWDALNEHGMCKWHRRTFVDHWLTEPTDESD
jgi:ribonuclease HII